jgi:serine/threonine protein kinase
VTNPLDGRDGSLDPELTQASEATAPSKETIGPYRLLQLVGEGGMGEVWLAEQTRPVHRQVALKVIKAGMDTAQVVVWFEARETGVGSGWTPGDSHIARSCSGRESVLPMAPAA